MKIKTLSEKENLSEEFLKEAKDFCKDTLGRFKNFCSECKHCDLCKKQPIEFYMMDLEGVKND